MLDKMETLVSNSSINNHTSYNGYNGIPNKSNDTHISLDRVAVKSETKSITILNDDMDRRVVAVNELVAQL
jgi:hypothetical protein